MSPPARQLRIAFLVPDNRDEQGRYSDPTPVFGPAPEALLQGFAQLPECEVHILSCVKHPLPSPARIADNIFYHSLVVPQLGWMRTFYWGCIRAIRKKLKELQPDVVHGQGSERYCALAAAVSRFPNVITLHGNVRAVARKLKARPLSFFWLAARLESLALRKTGGVVCISNYTRALTQELAKTTWVVHNAIQEEYFHLSWQPVTPPRILCVADILPYKNQLAAIAALAPLAEKLAFELRFLGRTFAGDAYSDAFQAAVARHSWARHDGPVTRPQLKKLLAESALSLLPTLEDNCPMAALEAFAAGVPFVGSRVGGLPDLVDHGRSGLLVNPQDLNSIRNAVGRLLENPGWAAQLAAQARKTAWERYRPEVVARRHLGIYQELLK